MKAQIVALPGDGVGPEVVGAAVQVLEAVAQGAGHSFAIDEAPVGGAAIDACGAPLPQETLARCLEADAILLGAIGGPKWDDPAASVRPEQGLLGLRKELGLYANIRPVHVSDALAEASPVRPDRVRGVDLVIVRELTGGIYFGQRLEAGADGAVAHDRMEYTTPEIERIAHVAFRMAATRRKLVTLVDKANVLACSRLWRRVVTEIAGLYPDVRFETMLVDAAAMHLIRRPTDFDVVLTGNMFGDILADEASMLPGSMGMLPSSCVGDGKRGLYEPIHGSAPDIAGQGVVNPIATILSAAMLLRHSLDLPAEADAVEHAVNTALADGVRTPDLAGGTENSVTTEQMTEQIIKRLEV